MPKALTLQPHCRYHVTLLALCVAVQAIDATEPIRRPLSDQDDMKLLLDELIPSNTEMTLFIEHARYIVKGIDASQ